MTKRSPAPLPGKLADVGEHGEPCRRCSECIGAEHHWMDNSECHGPEDPSHCCKHCEALGDECEVCDGEGGRTSPDGEPLSICLRCKGYGVVEQVIPAARPSCACPRIDARDCADFGSGRDLRQLLDAETLEDSMSDFDGGCPCPCHEPDEDEDDGGHP